MVLNDWLGYSAVDSLGEIIYVLCDRARLRHLPGSISLTVYLYIIIKHSFIHFLTSLIHDWGFKSFWGGGSIAVIVTRTLWPTAPLP